MPSRQIRRFAQHACLHINDSGNSDANARQLSSVAVFGGKLPDRNAHFVNHMVAAARDFRTESDLFQDPAVMVDGGDPQIGAAQVNADCKFVHARFDSHSGGNDAL